eukprot:358529-Chlamydomonas_euryale.AAC.1
MAHGTCHHLRTSNLQSVSVPACNSCPRSAPIDGGGTLTSSLFEPPPRDSAPPLDTTSSMDGALDKLAVTVAVARVGVLPRARYLDRTGVARAALGQVASLAVLINEREAVERAHDLALRRVDDALRRRALANQRHEERCVLVCRVAARRRHARRHCDLDL